MQSNASHLAPNPNGQAAGLPRQQVLLISDHYGALPQLRHAMYLFQQQLIGEKVLQETQHGSRQKEEGKTGAEGEDTISSES